MSAITLPVLILYGTDDKLCPPAGSRMLEQRIGSADKSAKAYDGLYHEILNEPERDVVLDDLCAPGCSEGWTPRGGSASAPGGSRG